MKHGMTDTSREAGRVQRDLLRAMPAWRKLELVFDLNETLKQLVLAKAGGLSSEDRLRLLADRWLGPCLAEAAYGPKHSHPESRRE